jgi:hypothetical protein
LADALASGRFQAGGTTNAFGPGPFFVAPGGRLTTITARIRDDLVRIGLNYKLL